MKDLYKTFPKAASIFPASAGLPTQLPAAGMPQIPATPQGFPTGVPQMDPSIGQGQAHVPDIQETFNQDAGINAAGTELTGAGLGSSAPTGGMDWAHILKILGGAGVGSIAGVLGSKAMGDDEDDVNITPEERKARESANSRRALTMGLLGAAGGGTAGHLFA